MREGVLIYDHESGRMDIRFDLLDYYGGLHCGECFRVYDGKWISARLEYDAGWVLVCSGQVVPIAYGCKVELL